MQIAELILLVMWVAAGLCVCIGSITNHPNLQCQPLFGVANRWGKLVIGVTLLTFVMIRVIQWQSSTNPNIIWSL